MSKKILLKPLVTEKTVANTKKDKFTFLVSRNARKEEIKNRVETVFGVNVVAVNVLNNTPEVKTNRFRQKYLKGGSRKAIVTLKKGQKIDLFEVETE